MHHRRGLTLIELLVVLLTFLIVFNTIACATTALAEATASRRPNIVLLLADDLRPDAIAALGNTVVRTPHLDVLAREGSVFTRAVCPNPICTPSRAEIITGASGFTNGVLYFGDRLNPMLPTWAGTLRRAGYHTWYVGKGDPDSKPSRLGYDESLGLFAGGGLRWETDRTDFNRRPITGYRGYVFQTEQGGPMPERGVGLSAGIDARFADAAIEFVRRRPKQPFFLHVNFTAPHDPLLMPPGYVGMYDADRIPLPDNFLPVHPFDHGNLSGRDEQLLPSPRTPADVRAELAVYYAVISHLDEQIGRILAALDQTGQAADTLVVFTSDHGLAIGSHGLRGKQNMYEHTIGVPLMMRGPRVPAGRRFDAQCYLRDLFPTACDLAGVEIPETVEGRSLVPVLTGKTDTLYPHVFGYFRDVQRMVRTDRYKLIDYPKIGKRQLFDLAADPHEMHDLADDARYARVLTDLRQTLREGLAELGDPLPR